MSGPKYLCRKKQNNASEIRAHELPESQPAALSDADARVLVPSSISSAWSGERTRLRDSSSSRQGLGSRQGVGRLRCAEALVTLEDCAGPFLEAADHHRRCPSMNILVGGTSGSDTNFFYPTFHGKMKKLSTCSRFVFTGKHFDRSFLG